MSDPKPFAFDTEFADDGTVVREGGTGRLMFTKAEVDAARAEARNEALAEIDAQRAAALKVAAEALVQTLAPVQAAAHTAAETLRREAAELALAAAKCVAGHVLDAEATDAAIGAFRELSGDLRDQPYIRLAVADGLASDLAHPLEQAKAAAGLNDLRIELDESTDMQPGDWRVEWAAGAIGFNRERVFSEIERKIAERFESEQPDLPLLAGGRG